MLKSELDEIEELMYTWRNSSENIALENSFQSKSHKVFEAWRTTTFSEISEKSLRRYFYYQLEGILKISDTLYKMSGVDIPGKQQNQLLLLLDHLKRYFPNYFNQDATAPIAFYQRSVELWSADVQLLKSKIEEAEISSELKNSVCKWVEELNEINYAKRYTFREIAYSKYVVEQMLLINTFSNEAENNLISFLCSANFNHLAFLVYRQGKIREKLNSFMCLGDRINYLHKQKAIVKSIPQVKNIVYDPSWPSIKTMLAEWLQEEIWLAEKSLTKGNEATITRIPLELSVAHLSCLIRLLYEESVFATQNLQSIFKGFAGYFQSKRQAVISPGSLSKEFYSIDQHTAARVRDLLQRMIQRINRNFFPMAVVVNATVLSYLSMR
ncbi:hypothetical protein ACS5PU_02375 [Pedobacter sp. GSP4]|uniref:hypothetical protein n=1 Tax=Pedobacter sp. GSP4 TaxID=3453716 RepID=UPI003EECAE9C